MDMKGTKKIFRTVALAVALIAVGQSTWAQNTFHVTNNGNVFTITRSGDLTVDEWVYGCTVNLSAANHYNINQITYGISPSTMHFEPGDTEKTIVVNETPEHDTEDAYKFQVGETRSYRFLVLDKGGFLLAYRDRDIFTGTSVPSSGIFEEKEVTVFTEEKTITEAGYNSEGRYNAVPIDDYFSNAAPQSYLNLIGAKLHLTVGLEAKEVNDGYQHIQILVDETDKCDTGNKSDDPGKIEHSHYLACFSHQQSGTNTTYASYTFPVTAFGDDCGVKTGAWSSLGNTVGDLRNQKFRTDSRDSNGKLIIPTNLNTLGIRFDAGGEDTDTWIVKNVKARITAVDETGPTNIWRTLIATKQARGNTIYFSEFFDEIVKVSGNLTLSTSWADLTYIAGDGTNVLTFSGVIKDDVVPGTNGTRFEIYGHTGTITDLVGNLFTGSFARSSSDYPEENVDYNIKYVLDGGNVTPSNPNKYNYDSQTFTLNNPTKAGYTFTGWTGSNGTTPQITVTIPKGSHGDLKFTANWAPVTLTEGPKDGVTAWWGTFFDSTHNYTLGEGAEAYTMGSDYHLYRLGTNGRTIPKGTAVVIIATKATPVDPATNPATATIQINPAGTEDLNIDVGGNILHGSDSGVNLDGGKVPIPGTENKGFPYVMSIDNTGVIGFRKYEGSAIPAHKAYYVE